MTRTRKLITAGLSLFAFLALAFPAGASAADRLSLIPGFDGTVNAITEPDANGVRYFGGNFTSFNNYDTGGSAVFDSTSGALNKTFPKVSGSTGSIYTSVSDGNGGFFIGGDFLSVDGLTHPRLAHINSDGSLDTTWAPVVNDGAVYSMVLIGGNLYIGGSFTTVNTSVSRSRLAAFSASGSGAIQSWNPNADNTVYAMSVSDTTIYMGGAFSSIGGTNLRIKLAAVGTDGTVASWAPAVRGTGTVAVYSIIATATSIYVGGHFTDIDYTTRGNLAALDPSTGSLQSLNIGITASTLGVSAMALSGSKLYIGGDFTIVGGTLVSVLTSINLTGNSGAGSQSSTGIPTVSGQSVRSILIDGSTVYIAGQFSTVGGQARTHNAKFTTSGTVLSGSAFIYGTPYIVYTQTLQGSNLYLGGTFTKVGGTPRANLAALNSDGTLNSWSADATGGLVTSLALSGSTLYVGGSFSAVKGTVRQYLAAVGTDGTLSAFNPAPNSSVSKVALADGILYVGGYFTTISSVARGYGAAYSTSNNTITSWNPAANTNITGIAVSGTKVYLAGSFTTLKGTARKYGGALGTDGTTLDAFNLNGNAAANIVEVFGSTVYYGGSFGSVGPSSVTRSGIAAFSVSDGSVLSWAPNVNGYASAIRKVGSTIFIGGGFQTVGGTARNRFAAVDTAGTLLSINPNFNNPVNAISATSGSNTIWIGGGFSTIGGVVGAGGSYAGGLYTPTFDLTAPAAPTVSGPAATTNSSSASLSFTGEAGATFQCSLDGAAYSSCTSSVAVSGLATGSHTFSVTASDANGNTSDAGTYSWTVDVTPPGAPSLSSAPASRTASTEASISFTSEVGATFTCSVDGGTYASCSSPKSLTSLAEGAHSLAVKATDAAGNTGVAATASWTVDLTAPGAPTLSGAPSSVTSSTTASISFSSEAGATFSCSIDGGSYDVCSSPQALSGLADGAHSLAVKATDTSGNQGAAATASWTVDTVAPSVPTIASGPSARTRLTNGSVAFTGDEGSTFACSVDGGGYSACSSPKSVAGLGNGEHSLAVKATDAAGNTSAAATHSWTVDVLSPPRPTVTGTPSRFTNSASATLSFSSEDGALFECSVDGQPYASCTSPFERTGLGDGLHSLAVKALDDVGNVSAVEDAQWTVDTVAPNTPTLSGVPASLTRSTSATISMAAEAQATFTCSVDGGAYATCSTPKNLSGLSDGSHSIAVKASDAAGNTSGAVTSSWTVDATAPGRPVLSGAPSARTNSTTASITIAGETGTTIYCSLDGGAYAACRSPKALSGLGEGSHTLSVKQADRAGNASSVATSTWIVDTAAPSTPVVVSKPASIDYSASATITFTGEAGALFTCSLDGSAYSACTSPAVLTGLSDGDHSFRIRQTDAAGNSSALSTTTWTVDLVAPAAPVITSAPPAEVDSSSSEISFTKPDGTTTECQMDNEGWSPCHSPQPFGLTDGNHKFYVRAVSDGHPGPAVYASFLGVAPRVSVPSPYFGYGNIPVHQVLTGSNGTLKDMPGNPTAKNVWARCTTTSLSSCVQISSGRSWQTIEADLGHRIRFGVTWRTASKTIKTVWSDPSDVVLPAIVTAPSIMFAGGLNHPVKGLKLGFSWGRFEGWNTVTSRTVQWVRCKAGSGCVNIPGAIYLAYKPVEADVGATLHVHWKVSAPPTHTLGSYKLEYDTVHSAEVRATR